MNKGDIKSEPINYDEIYEKWDEFEDCRISIPGENLWGKVLPDGTFGVSNPPIGGMYQWQDIVRSKNLDEDNLDQLVHRRWAHKFWFSYQAGEGSEAEELELREKIIEALKPLGHSGFWCAGQAYLLIKEEMTPNECRSNVVKALEAVGITLPEEKE